MLLSRTRGLLADAAFLGLIVLAVPVGILVVGTPIVLFVRLVLEVVGRL